MVLDGLVPMAGPGCRMLEDNPSVELAVDSRELLLTALLTMQSLLSVLEAPPSAPCPLLPSLSVGLAGPY